MLFPPRATPFRPLFATLCVVGALQCFSACAQPSKLPTVSAHFEGPHGEKSPTYKLEVCDDNNERSLGLMYRRELSDSAGMIFVFPDERENSFWMKNTYIPLDMVFVDKDSRVVGILENVPPLNEAPRSVGKPSKYVLEFAAGVTRKHQVKEGAKLVVQDRLPDAQ